MGIHDDYLRELFSVQCGHAYETARRLKETGTLPETDNALLTEAQDLLISMRDKFRVVVRDKKEDNNDGSK